MISTIFVDFGGVLAEDGFRTGLLTIAEQHGYDPEWFQQTAVETVYTCGYVDGLCEEDVFWELLKKNTKHSLEEDYLRRLFVSGFELWPKMFACIQKIKTFGYKIILISDHTNWLDEINEKNAFFHLFEKVYNSYHIHQSKRDGKLFKYVLSDLNVCPEKVLLIDDNAGNIERAKLLGLNVYQFTTTDSFIKDLMPVLSPRN